MTTRQREFCYHYASGLPAAKAAHAAGYAKSTSEHNGALMLRNPQVIAAITNLQGTSQSMLMQIFEAAFHTCLHTIRYDSCDKTKQGASREMRGWARVIKEMKPDRTLLPPLEESTQEEQTQAEAESAFGSPSPPAGGEDAYQASDLRGLGGEGGLIPGSQSTSTNQNPQPPKQQRTTPAPQQKNTPQEKDLLPDGRDAFDIQLSPQKPPPPPKPKSVIEVRNYIPKPKDMPPRL